MVFTLTASLGHAIDKACFENINEGPKTQEISIIDKMAWGENLSSPFL